MTSCLSVAFKDIRETPTTHCFTASIDEQFRYCNSSPYHYPGTQCISGRFPQGQRALPPTLAVNTDAHRLEHNIGGLQTRQFRYTQSSADGQMQHRPVPDPLAR